MRRRVRIALPPLKGSSTFQTQWYHCPTCERLRKLIDGAAIGRTEYGFKQFEREIADALNAWRNRVATNDNDPYVTEEELSPL